MQIILLHDVDSVGEQGAVVAVADGFARNYLFPRKLAIVACTGALRDLEGRKVQIQRKAEKRHQENVLKGQQVDAIGTLCLEAHAGEEGKLFGTITPKDLSQILEAKLDFPIDRKNLVLSSPINRVGQYELTIRLSARVKSTIIIEVNAPGGTPELAPEEDVMFEQGDFDNYNEYDEYGNAYEPQPAQAYEPQA